MCSFGLGCYGLCSYGLHNYGLGGVAAVLAKPFRRARVEMRPSPRMPPQTNIFFFGACRRRTPRGWIEPEGSVGQVSAGRVSIGTFRSGHGTSASAVGVPRRLVKKKKKKNGGSGGDASSTTSRTPPPPTTTRRSAPPWSPRSPSLQFLLFFFVLSDGTARSWRTTGRNGPDETHLHVPYLGARRRHDRCVGTGVPVLEMTASPSRSF